METNGDNGTEEPQRGIPVRLNVYDVTNAPSERTNRNIQRLNNITREINLGGIFHGALELQGREWSFGYIERGSGVYPCQPRKNPMYVFRETVELGTTMKSEEEIEDIIGVMSIDWQGRTYDLLARNCCHFCEELAKQLETTRPVPGWLNRFAAGADATVAFTQEAARLVKDMKTEISGLAVSGYGWLKSSFARAFQPATAPAAEPSADAGASGRGSRPASAAAAQMRAWMHDVKFPTLGGDGRSGAGRNGSAGRAGAIANGGGGGGGGGYASVAGDGDDDQPSPRDGFDAMDGGNRSGGGSYRWLEDSGPFSPSASGSAAAAAAAAAMAPPVVQAAQRRVSGADSAGAGVSSPAAAPPPIEALSQRVQALGLAPAAAAPGGSGAAAAAAPEDVSLDVSSRGGGAGGASSGTASSGGDGVKSAVLGGLSSLVSRQGIPTEAAAAASGEQ